MALLIARSLSKFMRRIGVVARRRRWYGWLEPLILALVIGIGLASYLVLTGGKPGEKLLTPSLFALLLIANLLPAIALLVLFGRRLARGRAARSPVGGHGQLHVRLVALFSVVASIPVLLMVVFASFLFQYGVEFWYSDRARGMFENANDLAQVYYAEKQQTVVREAEVMAADINYNLALAPIDSKDFQASFAYQVLNRELSEGAILSITKANGVQSLALVNPYNRPPDNWVPPDVIASLLKNKATVFRDSGRRMEAVTPIPNRPTLYVYASKVADNEALAQTKRFALVLNNYNSLVDRSRVLQLQFHAALYLIALFIIGVVVIIALNVADRLVKPVGELVDAARRVTAGDLAARVSGPLQRDEIGTLGSAFNRMTDRLAGQRNELIAASELIERRRALIEAVLSGVSAGVIAINADHTIRIMNSSASVLLGVDRDASVGCALASISPELDALAFDSERESVVQIGGGGGDARTLAVKLVRDEFGEVLTFDDITQQLTDQRRAAWADVARRIAHEIKNPLTPIQLAAERLQRRFMKEVTSDPATFGRLTDTIVRQVGDLRRMVDEFSSFARMPKPVFRNEALIDICRQAVFLHEVAHPAISFRIRAPDADITMFCDRRQLGQALTNIIKNGVEAIEVRSSTAAGELNLDIAAHDDKIMIAVSDNGIGLPLERDRLAEPYMTTRERGTGLGLAIVKKIVEEHGGAMTFADRDGGGTTVTLTFSASALVVADGEHSIGDDHHIPETSPPTLTRIGSD